MFTSVTGARGVVHCLPRFRARLARKEGKEYLQLCLGAGQIQFYRLDTGERLLTAAERAAAEAKRAEAEAQRAAQETERADREVKARQAAEAELAQLRAELLRRSPG